MKGDGWVMRTAARDVNGRVHLTVCLRDLSIVSFIVSDSQSTVDGIDALVAAYNANRLARKAAVG